MDAMQKRLLLITVLLAGAAFAATPADTVLLDGKVYTVDAARSWAEAVATRDTRASATSQDVRRA